MTTLRILPAALALCCAGHALAQTSPPKPERKDWQVSYGGAVISGPRFTGAGSNGVLVLPFIEARYKDFLFLSPLRGIGVEIALAQGLTASAAITADFASRREEDSARLRGLGDVDYAPAVALEVNYRVSDLFFKADLRSRFGSENGQGTTLGADLGYNLVTTQTGVFSAGLNLRAMDDSYAKNFFGVTAAQSAASALPVYRAASGLKSAGVFGQAFYRINNDWGLFGRLNLSTLQGDAATSPITEQKDQISLVASVSRAF